MDVQKKSIQKHNNILMDYIFKKCDAFSVTKRYDQHKEENETTINTISLLEKCLPKDLINNYSKKYLDKLYNQFKDNDLIFNEAYKEKYECKHSGFSDKFFDELKEMNREVCIKESIDWLYYDNVTNNWLSKNKENIILKKEDIIPTGLIMEGFHISTTYFLKLTKELQEEILSKNSLYDWCFPYSVEDICFYENGRCWLLSVAHEEICDIFCENEEEYEYLKSIGIKFVDNKFTSIPPEYIIYEDYNNMN